MLTRAILLETLAGAVVLTFHVIPLPSAWLPAGFLGLTASY
jgi:hypothetical protein